MGELTNSQEEFFKILTSLDHERSMSKLIEHAKEDTRERNTINGVVRGVSRVKGFTPNEK